MSEGLQSVAHPECRSSHRLAGGGGSLLRGVRYQWLLLGWLRGSRCVPGSQCRELPADLWAGLITLERQLSPVCESFCGGSGIGFGMNVKSASRPFSKKKALKNNNMYPTNNVKTTPTKYVC